MTDIRRERFGHLWLLWARIPGTKVMILIASQPYEEVAQ